MADRSGIEIDFCPTCRGVWLERGELDKIIERSAAAAAPAPEPPQPAYRPDYDDDDRRYQQPGHHGYHKHRKRKSFLSDIFDFD